MIKNRRLNFLLIFLALAFTMLACGLGGGSEPTQAPPPAEPTTAPEMPTDLPVEPTDIPEPTEAPTEEMPVEEPTLESPAEPVEPPPENVIYIEEVNGYRDGTGTLHIVGLVTNYTDRVVDNIEIEINILDVDETSLFTDITTASLYTLAPGESTPFSYWIYEDLPAADSYIATVVGQGASEVERATVSIEGVTMVVDDSGDLHLTGNLINNSETPVEVQGLAAATFDANGDLYTANNHSVLIRHLDPGEDGPFRVTMTGSEEGTSNISEYEIYIDAETTDPVETFDLVFSESQFNYTDTYGSFHLVGEITNNHNEFLTLSMVAGIYDDEGNVIDAATTDIPTFTIAPGDILPYDFQYWGPLNYKAGATDQASSYTVQWDPYWTWTSTSEYIELTTQTDTNEVSSYQITFTGEVLNNSNSEVEGATVIVSLYEIDSGELVHMGYGGIYEPIGANQIAEYTVWIDIPADFNIDAVEYVIIAKGDLP